MVLSKRDKNGHQTTPCWNCFRPRRLDYYLSNDYKCGGDKYEGCGKKLSEKPMAAD